MIEFGIYCAPISAGRANAPGTVSGAINLLAEAPQIRWAQTAVPVDFSVGFGVIARTEAGRPLDTIIVTLTHPPFPGSGIEVEQ